MKQYFVFGILVVAILIVNFFNKSFVKKIYIPEVQPLSLPKVQKLKKFKVCNINPFAFKPNECFVKILNTKSEKNNSLRLDLSMIYFVNGEGYCKINGKLLRVGQGLRGFKVIKIEKDMVLVDVRGKRKWLKLDVYATQKD